MELDFVAWLKERLPRSPETRIGVGDDAAVVDLDRPELVTTADLLIDGVHFLTAEHGPELIGRKALAVNLSDLAAMAAKPAGAVVSLALPFEGCAAFDSSEVAKRLIEGMLPLADEFGCPIVGGDTNTTSGPLVVAVTAFGVPAQTPVIPRCGAQPGDWIMVTGSQLGGSLTGHHLRFTPRVHEALQLAEQVPIHAMMDLSDGLSLDLKRMCLASEVGAVVEATKVPISAAAERVARASGRSALDHALSDGEDFELLVAVAPDEARALLADPPCDCGLTCLGQFQSDPAILLRQPEGTELPLSAGGYQHR